MVIKKSVMALPNVGMTCYVNIALQILADITQDSTLDGFPMLKAALMYLRHSRTKSMSLKMPRALMAALCIELGIEIGVPDDPSSILMQLCLEDNLVQDCAVSRICSDCNAAALVGVPELPFSLIAVPTSSPKVELLSLFGPTDDAEKKCPGCGNESDTTLAFGAKHTLVYLTRDATQQPVEVDFPLVLGDGQELMGIAFWKSHHYTYLGRHTDGAWRFYNDESVTLLPATWFPDDEVRQDFSTRVVALVYGPPHKTKDELVTDLYKLSPLEPRLFSKLYPRFRAGPWTDVCLNDCIFGRILYTPDSSEPRITEDNWIIFHDFLRSGRVFLLPAGHSFLTNEPLRAAQRQNQPRINIEVMD